MLLNLYRNSIDTGVYIGNILTEYLDTGEELLRDFVDNEYTGFLHDQDSIRQYFLGDSTVNSLPNHSIFLNFNPAMLQDYNNNIYLTGNTVTLRRLYDILNENVDINANDLYELIALLGPIND